MTSRYNKKITIFITALTLIFINFSRAEELNAFTYRPHFRTGQIWLVEVEKESEEPSIPREMLKDWKPTLTRTYYRFEVEKLQEIDNETCFPIKIEVVDANRSVWSWNLFYKIYIRENDFTMKKIQRLRMEKENTIVEAEQLYHRGPINAYDWVGSLPINFPYFDPNAFDYEPKEKVKKAKIGSEEITYVEWPPKDIISQKVNKSEIQIDSKKEDAVEITLSDKNDSQKRVTKQIWVKDLPWWTEATIIRDGNEWCTARLIRVDGNDIVVR